MPAALLALALSGCASVPDQSSIPPERTVGELSQDGQSALDDNNYAAAEVYYQTIINRYGTDASVAVAAEFEIAHIRMKQKDWPDAAKRLGEIIQKYASAGGTALPPEYLVLAKNDFARVPEAARKPYENVKAPAQPTTVDQTAADLAVPAITQ